MSSQPAVQPAANLPAAPARNGNSRKSILAKVADRWHCDPVQLATTLKQTAFRQSSGEVSDAQMMALLIVADQYGLNPFTKELYAYPDKNNGVVPVVSVDGWNRIMQEHPQFAGMDFEYPPEDEWVKADDHAKVCPPYIWVIIRRKDREYPIRVREFLDECYRPPFIKDGRAINGPWQSHTKRMLRHKAMIQSARVAFGFGGIYDDDEAQRITEAEVVASETRRKPVRMPEAIDGGEVA